MHYKIHTGDRKGNLNTGSSSNLVNYLEKETQGNWFNHEEDQFKATEVENEIDRYGRGQIKSHEWKFVELEINPSHKEQQIIIEKATGKTNVNNWNQLSYIEKEKSILEFREYVRLVQDEQAKNYNREKINTGADLKYYGKIETERKIKGFDKEYKNGKQKQGEKKHGLHLHAHIIQSRKAANKKTKLSPASKHKNQTTKNVIKQGFDRNKFANNIEKVFDKRYLHNRKIEESFEWKKANKFNRLEKKISLEKEFNNMQKDMKPLNEIHYKLSQDKEIETYQDYVKAMEQENIKVSEIKNENNETIDLRLHKGIEIKKFTELQEEMKQKQNEEIKSRWIKEQESRREQLKQEQERQIERANQNKNRNLSV